MNAKHRLEAVGMGLFMLAVFIATSGAALWAVWLIGTAVLGWAKDGVWVTPSTGMVIWQMGLGQPNISWVGLDSILQWFLRLPGAVGLLFAAWAGGAFLNACDAEMTATAKAFREPA